METCTKIVKAEIEALLQKIESGSALNIFR